MRTEWRNWRETRKIVEVQVKASNLCRVCSLAQPWRRCEQYSADRGDPSSPVAGCSVLKEVSSRPSHRVDDQRVIQKELSCFAAGVISVKRCPDFSRTCKLLI